MTILRLAGNLITGTAYGHWQLVNVNGQSQTELEVQAPNLFIAGSWTYGDIDGEHTTTGFVAQII